MALSDLEGLTAVCGIAIRVILRRIMRQVCRSRWEAPPSCKGRVEESVVQVVGAGDWSQPVPTVAGLSRELENDEEMQRRCNVVCSSCFVTASVIRGTEACVPRKTPRLMGCPAA